MKGEERKEGRGRRSEGRGGWKMREELERRGERGRVRGYRNGKKRVRAGKEGTGGKKRE